MNEQELRDHAICAKCKQKIGHTGLPLFWTIKSIRHGIKADAMRRSTGLAMAMGSASLAMIMGPNEEMTQIMHESEVTICEECAMEHMGFLESCGAFE
jgi:hypothetical protein